MTELVERHNPSERQLKFREQYRASIHRLYSGPVHIGVIYIVGLSRDLLVRGTPYRSHLGVAAGGAGILLLQPVRVVDPQVRDAPAGRRMGAACDLRSAYASASPVLHRQRDDGRQRRASGASSSSPGARCSPSWGWAPRSRSHSAGWSNANAGYILMITIIGQYLIYETFHYCCHVHDNWFVRYAPFVNTIRRHHTAHHNQGIMMDSQHEPDVPDRRLGDGHERPRARAARARCSTATTKTTSNRS